LLTRFGLTCPEASSKVCHDSFCQSGSSVSLSWVVYYEAFCFHESLYLIVLQNLSGKFVSLKSEKNNGHFT
jgi:hypothetical protein